MAGNSSTDSRQLSPYEKTHWARFGQGELDLSQLGEKPIEYLTGKVEFRDFVFHVSSETLIPRIESEMMIDLAIKHIHENNLKTPKIAEVGTGCGAIGLSLYLELVKKDLKPQIYLSDVSSTALEVAQQNVNELVGKTEQINILESDLLADFPPVKFDVMIANLPYIPSDRINYLDESVKDFEPHVALDGGPNGLSLISEFVKQAQDFLKKDGAIFLEIDYTHDEETLRQNLELGKLKLKVKQDEFHRTRFAILNQP